MHLLSHRDGPDARHSETERITEMRKLRVELVATVAGLALVAGLSGQAKADPEFTINPNQAGVTVPTVTTFTANEMGALSVPRIPEVLAGTLKSS